MVTSDEVRGELVELRGASGLSAARVKGLAPQIMSLPTVDAFMNKRGIASSDRHVAADSVIRCVVRRQLQRSDWATILERTLNINGPWGRSLTDRRRNIVAEMNLSLKQYNRIEEEAFVQLAATLLVFEESACDVEGPDRMFSDEMVVQLILSESNRLEGILRILPNMTREQACRMLIAQLPRGQEFVEGHLAEIIWPGQSLLGPYESAIMSVVSLDFPSDSEGLRSDPFLGGRMGDLFAKSNFAAFLSRPGNWYDAHNCVGVVARKLTRGSQVTVHLNPDNTIDSAYFDMKGNSVAYLVNSLQRMELSNSWYSLVEYLESNSTPSGQELMRTMRV